MSATATELRALPTAIFHPIFPAYLWHVREKYWCHFTRGPEDLSAYSHFVAMELPPHLPPVAPAKQ